MSESSSFRRSRLASRPGASASHAYCLSETSMAKSLNKRLGLGIFILIVVGMGALIGLMIQPGEWYASLTKPPFNPPNWVFGPAWTILYILIAIAGWKIWTA